MELQCSKCQLVKDSSHFYSNSNKKTGHDCYCKSCRKELRKTVYYKPEEETKRSLKWASKNPDKKREINNSWGKKNRHITNANAAKYRSCKLQATPKWANLFFIQEAYALAKLRSIMTGFEWHVDHVIPLQGKNVCGLHVEYNLQVIPKQMNLEKSNKLIEGAQ